MDNGIFIKLDDKYIINRLHIIGIVKISKETTKIVLSGSEAIIVNDDFEVVANKITNF